MKKISIARMGNFLPIVLLIIAALYLKKAFASGGLLGNVTSIITDGKTSSELKDEGQVQETINTVDLNKGGLTLSETALRLAVDALDKAMRDWGTDTDKIFEVLKGKSIDDLKYIYKAFGYRKETLFGLTSFAGDLFAWFNAELSGDDLQKVGMIFKPTGLWPYAV